MKKYGLRIAQPGYDARTDPKERMVFDSGFDTLKLRTSGSGNQSVAAANIGTFLPGTATVTIPHGMPYPPVVMVFTTSVWRTSAEFSPYAYRQIGAIAPDGAQYAVDDTNLYIHLYNGDPGGARTIYYRYHIYYNELA